MARPVETSDETLLAAAARVLNALGPDRFTLARVAEDAGVSAATLVKRFGSKDALYSRMSQRWVDRLGDQLTAAARGDSPLERLRAVALYGYRDLADPAQAHHQLAALAVDLQRAELRDLLHQGWATVRAHLQRHLEDAMAADHLRGAPAPERLARILHAALEGGCVAWSVCPDGALIDRLAEDLDAILAPWTTTEDPS